MPRNWYSITNKAESNSADIYLYDEIGMGGIDSFAFLAELNQLDAEQLDVHINSVGGEVFQGFAIYQGLRDHPANVHVHVDALAASIASVIAMAGDEVTMARNAEFMIHDGMVGVQGNAADLSKVVETLDRVSNNIASVYAERTGTGDINSWRDKMRAETWYSAEEAVEAGLADNVAEASPRKARNVSELAVFNYSGRKFAPAPNIATPAQEPDQSESAPEWDTESILNAIKEAFDCE